MVISIELSGRRDDIVVTDVYLRNGMLPELIGSLKLGNVWVFVQLIHRPTRNKNQLYKNPNIA